MEKDKLIFERREDYKFYNVKAWSLKEPNNGDSLIEVFKNGQIIRSFLFPSYKIYNIKAHFEDIVEGEIEGSARGYEMAAWNGISGATTCFLEPKAK